MARGKGLPRGASSRSKGKTKGADDGLNAAYREMLAEAEVESLSTQTGDEGRPLKRRRVRGQIGPQDGEISSPPRNHGEISHIPVEKKSEGQDAGPSDREVHMQASDMADHPLRQEQVAYKDETSDESDFAWEEVDLAQEADQSLPDPTNGGDEQEDLNLVLNDDGNQNPNLSAPARRKVLTAGEKKLQNTIPPPPETDRLSPEPR
ncbi:MAG: hypothetical protein Q9207_008471 [Kuettlingeria erythrocarpa]